jgi:hypothetical protein
MTPEAAVTPGGVLQALGPAMAALAARQGGGGGLESLSKYMPSGGSTLAALQGAEIARGRLTLEQDVARKNALAAGMVAPRDATEEDYVAQAKLEAHRKTYLPQIYQVHGSEAARAKEREAGLRQEYAMKRAAIEKELAPQAAKNAKLADLDEQYRKPAFDARQRTLAAEKSFNDNLARVNAGLAPENTAYEPGSEIDDLIKSGMGGAAKGTPAAAPGAAPTAETAGGPSNVLGALALANPITLPIASSLYGIRAAQNLPEGTVPSALDAMLAASMGGVSSGWGNSPSFRPSDWVNRQTSLAPRSPAANAFSPAAQQAALDARLQQRYAPQSATAADAFVGGPLQPPYPLQ